MYTVIDTKEDRVQTMNLQQLSAALGEQLDDAFFSPVFTSHVLEHGDKRLIVMEEK